MIAFGYFDNLDAAADAVEKYDGRGAVYMTMNPIKAGVEARCLNRIQENPKNTTGDNEIARRLCLLVDFDPKRASGISSTDGEHAAAIDCAKKVAKWLRDERGWPNPTVIDSGNGAHLAYDIDEPNDVQMRDLLKSVLATLADLFGDDTVDVDEAVFNAARIVKVPGTIAKKGDNTPQRPHRRSRILYGPKTATVVTRAQLEAIAAARPVDRPQAVPQRDGLAGSFDLVAFIATHRIAVRSSNPWNGGVRHILGECIFDPSHTGTSAVLLQSASGAIAYKCQHNSCVGYAWADVREKFEPGYRERSASFRDSATSSNGPTHTAGYQRAAVAEPLQPIEWDDSHPWPTLDPAAYHGLAGEIVTTLQPQTEAHPAALLFTLLTVSGNIAGRWVRARVQDDEHPARLFIAIVGATSTGAKGTSYATVRPIVRAAAPKWLDERVLNGFGSGEAVIAELAPQRAEDPDAPKAVPDPRLLVFDPEFARILAVNSREGSTQSMILRTAWDGGRLSVRRSRSRLVAPDSHVSVIGHITPDELRSKLTSTDCTSGFANRFLFVLSQRSKRLPSGGKIDLAVIGTLARRLHEVVAEPAPRVLHRTPEAECLWHDLYIGEPDRDGLLGALTARPAAQRLRLAVAYALLDGALEIGVEHLLAADACWRYNVASIEHLFGGLRGDDVQDRLLNGLRDVHPNGLTGAQQGDLFGKSLKPGQLQVARDALENRRLVRTERAESDGKPGRPAIVSYAVPRSLRLDKPGQSD